MKIWEVAAWEIANLGSCRLGKYPWDVAAWENILGMLPLGKYPWDVATWENILEKLPLGKRSLGKYLKLFRIIRTQFNTNFLRQGHQKNYYWSQSTPKMSRFTYIPFHFTLTVSFTTF